MKIVNLIVIGLITGAFIFSCENKTQNIVGNFVDKNNLQSPTCQNNSVITGNIYVNDKFVDSSSLKAYLDSVKDQTALENVEVTYNNKTVKSDANGVFNLPKSEIIDGNTKIKFTKQGYIPFETTVYETCLFHVGLSPLYENELSAKELKLNSKSGISTEFTTIPDSMKSVKGDEKNPYYFSYIIVDSTEKAKKLNLGEYYSISDKESVVENLDYTKEMQIIMTTGQIFGMSSNLVDTIMESNTSLVLGNHKPMYKNLLPSPPPMTMGDTFRIVFQSIILPKSDKEIVFDLSKDVKVTLSR